MVRATPPGADAIPSFRRRLAEQVQDLGGRDFLVLRFSTAREVGNLFLGALYDTTTHVPLPGAYGMSRDKISQIKIRLAGNHTLDDGNVEQLTLTYGGVSMIRSPKVGLYSPDREDRVKNEFISYSTRFWQYTGPDTSDYRCIGALTVQGVEARRSRNPAEPDPSSQPSKTVIELADRSVAATEWILRIPLNNSRGEPNFDINELDDIEMQFYHHATSRSEVQTE